MIVSALPLSAWGTSGELDKAAREIQGRLPFEVRVSNVAPSRVKTISYRRIDTAEYPDALQHLQLLNEEFGKYPPAFLRKSGLKWAGLVKNLTVSGESHSAAFDYLERALLFDVRQGSRNKLYLRYTLHHEFFHLIDFVMMSDQLDQRWLALNPAGFHYRTNVGMRDSGTVMLDHPQTGFVTTYAISSIHEDRAEIHAALFVREHYRDLVRIMQKDSVVRRKVSYIVQMLHRIDPAINEAYFQRLHELRTPALSK